VAGSSAWMWYIINDVMFLSLCVCVCVETLDMLTFKGHQNRVIRKMQYYLYPDLHKYVRRSFINLSWAFVFLCGV
jgi:hypothetical protein